MTKPLYFFTILIRKNSRISFYNNIAKCLKINPAIINIGVFVKHSLFFIIDDSE